MASNVDRSDMPSKTSHLIDDLSGSFQDCLAILTSQEYFNNIDTDETKAGFEVALQRFLEIARQAEAFFIHKRMVLSKQRPEDKMKEATDQLRAELERKDALIKKHQEKLQKWQALMATIARGQGQTNTQQSQQQQHQQVHQTQALSQILQTSSSTSAHHSSTMSTQSLGMPAQHGMTSMNQMSTAVGQGPMASASVNPSQIPSQQMMAMRTGSMHQGMPHQQPPPAYPQSSLAFLEQTTSNIGMPERR